MSEPFLPKGAIRSKDNPSTQIRLLLHGRPGSGKTSSAATFPSPIWADFDNSKAALDKINSSIPVLNFFDPEWVMKTYKVAAPSDGFKLFLASDAKQLSTDQTLVIDSLSKWQDAFHAAVEKHPEAQKNAFFLWGEKVRYFRDVHAMLSSLKCNVIVIAHDKEIRDEKSGALLGKVVPSMSGSFADSLGVHYPDVYHQFTDEKKNDKGQITTTYFWQLRGDAKYDLKCTLATNDMIIPATYEEYSKRKVKV